MSRQFDEYMEGKFEIYGELYEIVEPGNFDELIKAMQVRDEIQNMLNSLMHDEDSSNWESLLQEQEDYIKAYIENLGDFDNSILSSNISYQLNFYQVLLLHNHIYKIHFYLFSLLLTY